MKKTTFSLLALALLFGFGSALYAQGSAPQFTVVPPAGGVINFPEGTNLGLRNAAELQEELQGRKVPYQGGPIERKDPGFCAGIGGGFLWPIGVGFYLNARDVGLAAFDALVVGGSLTFASTCPDLDSTPPCQLFGFDPLVWGDNAIIAPAPGSGIVLQSIGCLP